MKYAKIQMDGDVTLKLGFDDDVSPEDIKATVAEMEKNGELQPLYEAAFRKRSIDRQRALSVGFPLAGGEKGQNRFASPEFTEQALAEQGTSLSDPMRALAATGTTGAILTGLEKGTLGQIPAIGGSIANIGARLTGIEALKRNAQIAEEWQRKEEEMSTLASTAAKSKGGTEVASFALGEIGGGFLSGAGEGKVITSISTKLFPKLAARLAAEPFKAGVGLAARVAAPVEVAKGAIVALGYPEGATPEQKAERLKAGATMAAVGTVGSLAGGFAHAKGLQAAAKKAAAAKPGASILEELKRELDAGTAEAVAESPSVQVHQAGNAFLADILARAKTVVEEKVKVAESLAKKAGAVPGDPKRAEFELANEMLDSLAGAREGVRKSTADIEALQNEFFQHTSEGYFRPAGKLSSMIRFVNELQDVATDPLLGPKSVTAQTARQGVAANRQYQAEVLKRVTELISQHEGNPELQKQFAAMGRQFIEAAKSGKSFFQSEVGPVGALADHLSLLYDGAVRKLVKTDPGFERLFREYAWHQRQGAPSQRKLDLANNLIKRMEHEAGQEFGPKMGGLLYDNLERVAKNIYEGVDDNDLVGIRPLESGKLLGASTAPPQPVRQTPLQFIVSEFMKNQVMDDDPRLVGAFDIAKSALANGYSPGEINAAMRELITNGVEGVQFFSHAFDVDASKGYGFTPEQLEAVPKVPRDITDRYIAGLIPGFKTTQEGLDILQKLAKFSAPVEAAPPAAAPVRFPAGPGDYDALPKFAPLPEVPSIAKQKAPITLPEYEKIKSEIQQKLDVAVKERQAAIKDFMAKSASLADYLGVKVDLEKLMDWDPKLKPEQFEGKFEKDLNRWFESALKAQLYWSQRAEANMKVAAELAIKENALRVGAPLEGRAPKQVTIDKGVKSGLSRKERVRLSELSKKLTDDERLRFQVAVRAAANEVDYKNLLDEMEKIAGPIKRGNEFKDSVRNIEAKKAGLDLPKATADLTDDLMERGGKYINLTPEEKKSLQVTDNLKWSQRFAIKAAGLANILKLNFAKGLLSDAEMDAWAQAQRALGEMNRQQGATQWMLKQFQRPEGGFDRDTSMAVFLALDDGGAEKLMKINANRVARGEAPAYGQEFVELVGKVGAFAREVGREAKAQELWDPDAQMRTTFLPRILNGDAKQLSTLAAALKEEARKGNYGWDSPRMFRSIYDLAEKQGILPKTMDFREVIAFYIDSVQRSIETAKLIKYAVDKGAVMEPGDFLKAGQEGKVRFSDWVPIEDGRFMKREIYQPMAGIIGPMGGFTSSTRAGAEVMGIRNIRFSGDFNIPLQLMRAFALHPIKMFDPTVWKIALDPDPRSLPPELQAIQKAGGMIAMGGEHYERPQSYRKSYIEEAWSRTLNTVFHAMAGKFGKKGASDILSTQEVDPAGQVQLSYFAPAIKRAFYLIEHQRAMNLKAKGDKFYGPMSYDDITAHIVSKVEPALMNGQIQLSGISPRAQDTLRFFFGAPSWNLAILRNMAGAIEELGGVVKTGSLSNTLHLKNTLAQMMFTAAAAQTINMLVSYARGNKEYKPDITNMMDLFMVDLGIPDPNQKVEKKNLGLNLLGPAFRYWASLANIVAYSSEMKNRTPTQLAQPWLYEGTRVTKGLLNPAFQLGVDFMAPKSTILSLSKSSAAEEQFISDAIPVSWRTLAEWRRDGYLPDRALEIMAYEWVGIGRKTSSANRAVLMDYTNLQNSVDANLSRIKYDVEQKHPESARAKIEEAVKMMDDFRQRWEKSDYWPILKERYDKLGKKIMARSK